MKHLVIEKYGAKLYLMHTKELKDESHFDEHYKSLSIARRKKVDSYMRLEDKRLSLAAGILMKKGLENYGLQEREAVVAYGENGKPYLPEHPSIHFNLSHSGEMVLAVFAEVEAGCDIEKMQDADMELAKRFFSSGEYQYIAGQPEGKKRREAFYRLWTLKESFTKAAGTGFSLPLNSFEIRIMPDGRADVFHDLDVADYQFKEIRLEEYYAAVCFRRPFYF
ncbi:MAG: 4'-phosphopantetheinyl transferase superfamily protein [Lachnospiraceae bacterium]|nr:4'-phosphopantetheinyl transferase superfamily protein [Lachnospiraceae bacterium]